jgi:putative transposase
LPGFARAFGCTRFVVNDALAFREAAHAAGQPYPDRADLSARLTAIKADPERAWLNEVSAVILQQALADLEAAYRRYFVPQGDADMDGGRPERTPAPPGGETAVADAARFPGGDGEAGIDLGLTHFAVLSDGRKIASPRFRAAPNANSGGSNGPIPARRREA